ncbi:MAG: universal stress protein [Pseudomonadales bacterium]
MKTQSIVTILDKPKHRQVAFERAMKIQDAMGAHVDLLGFCWHPMAEAKQSFDNHQRAAIKREIMRAEKEWQRQLVQAEAYRARNITLETLWSANIADWVVNRLRQQPSDLLVKTAHRSQSFMHAPLDWALLERSPVPLLLATNKSQNPSGRVIATIDLQNQDATHMRLNRKVLDAAAHFAKLYNGQLHCICVIEFSEILRDLDIVDARKHKREVLTQQKETLTSLVAPYGIAKSRLHAPTGKVGQRVNQLSHKLNADLLVVGTHAKRLKERFRLGNSAERILTKATCDVLAVPP